MFIFNLAPAPQSHRAAPIKAVFHYMPCVTSNLAPLTATVTVLMRCSFPNVHLCPPPSPSRSVPDLMPLLCLHPPPTLLSVDATLAPHSTPPPARPFKKPTSSAPKTAATATASRATATTTPPTEVIQPVSPPPSCSPSPLRSKARAALICRHGVFVIMNGTMQNCWCGWVISNFLNLEVCEGAVLPRYWLASKDP